MANIVQLQESGNTVKWCSISLCELVPYLPKHKTALHIRQLSGSSIFQENANREHV